MAINFPNRRKLLIIMCGLPGSGKTTTAYRIRQSIGPKTVAVVNRDSLRRRRQKKETLHEFSYRGGSSVDINFFGHAKNLLKTGFQIVVLDATFRKREKREEAHGFAETNKCDFIVVMCSCPHQILLRRLEMQMNNGSKHFIRPVKEVLEFYLSDTDPIGSELNSASIIRYNTDTNHTVLVQIAGQNSVIIAKVLRAPPSLS